MTAPERPSPSTDLPNAADAAALKALIPELVEACPDLYEMASEFARRILAEHGLPDLDPNQVYWHRFHGSQSNERTFTGWEHLEHPYESMTLTQLVIQRFTVHDQDNADLLDNDCGFYTAGPEAGTYDETNEVRLFASQVLKAFWAYNFVDHYKQKVESFWQTQGQTFRTLAKCTYLAKALEDYEAGRLTVDHLRTVIKACAGTVTWPARRDMLDAEFQPGNGLRLRRLSVGGFVSTDILCIVDGDQRQIVYVPGELFGFHVFESIEDLHWWILCAVESPSGRKRFLSHFQAADHDIMEDTAQLDKTTETALALFPGADLLVHFFHEPKVENVGLEHVLDLLFSAWKSKDHQLLKDQDAYIQADAFSYLRDATHARMISDATFLMKSNGELRKKLWMGYLNAFGRMFGPMAAVGWPVALVVVGAGAANVGLNVDQAVNGKTAVERKAGVTGAIVAAINTLFNALFLKGGGSLPEIADAEEALIAEEQIAEPALQPVGGAPLEELVPERFAPLEPEDFLSSFKTQITEPTQEGSGIAKGVIETPSGKKFVYMRWGTSQGHYQVRYVGQMKSWVIIDPANPWSFYRNIPVRQNEYLHWEPVAPPGLKGGVGGKIFGVRLWGQSPHSLPKVDTPAMPYDVPEASRPALRAAAEGRVALGDLDDGFITLRRRLNDDANAFFAAPRLPARPEIPAFPLSAAPRKILKDLLKNLPGLVLGEGPLSIAGKQLLIENMSLLSKLKVRTLYLRHLFTDFHQADLDAFTETGNLSPDLEGYLKHLDNVQGADPTGQFSFLELIRAAQKNHIRVQAIDCMANYRTEGMTGAADAFQAKMDNYFARTVIDADQAARGAHKWVALVNESSANTVNQVPGLSEIEGTAGLRLEEAAIGKARGVEPDPGKTIGSGAATTTIRNDLRLQLETPAVVSTARKLDKLLTERGMFTLVSEEGGLTVVNRNRDGALIRTRVLKDGSGYFVVRPEWSSVNGRRFSSLERLRDALVARHMQPVKMPVEAPLPMEPVPGTSTAPATTVSPSVTTRYDVHALSRNSMKDWVLKMEQMRGSTPTFEETMDSFEKDLHLTSRRASLLVNAESVENDVAWNLLPERPPVPTQSANIAEFIKDVFRNAQGLVIGESADRIASARFLLENMASFARQGVKTLYLPRLLNDFHQIDLDLFFASPTASMSSDLEAWLTLISTDQSPVFNDLEVIRSARLNGIRVQATDCAASYTLTSPGFSPVESQRISNYLTSQIIHADQSLHGTGKWIAVTAPENTNTFRNVVGLSERNAAVGLRIEEVGPGKGHGITLDNGIEIDRYELQVPVFHGTTDTLFADLYLPMETPLLARTVAQRQRLLFKPGFYCVERSGQSYTIWHRSANDVITPTPVERLDNGNYFINRPTWPTVDRQPYPHLLDLTRALNGRGMHLQGRLPD